MSTIVTRAGKGSALTYAEVDSNFTNLNTDKYQSGSTASLASLTLASALPVLSGGTGVTTSTGSGSVVLSTSPTLVTPLLGTPTSGNFSTGTFTWPTFNQNTTGTAARWTTARLLAGNSVDGSANVAFANKFIVQGTTDTGLSGAQFLGALGTGIIKNTTTTGVLSLAAAATDYVAPSAYASANGLTMATSRLLGRTTALSGAAEEISVSGGLTLTGGVLTGTSGTVTAVSVASANGFAGASSGGATPALTLSTTITGVLKGNATAIAAATAGTDYSAGTSALATGILKSTTTTGALSIAVAADFPTLNQNTTGTAAGLSATLAVTSGGTGTSTAFTTGSVMFAGASGVYSQDNANFFWDNTNNRLGIGLASPTVELEVTGEAIISERGSVGTGGFSGGTLTFSAPAKLQLGSGTYTDTVSAASSTNALAPIAAFRSATIAATNTAVTYTNAATIFVSGPPVASTNVTFTNEYSLYINSGQFRFPGSTRKSIVTTVVDSTGDVYGMEQVSSAQSGTNAALRLFCSSAASAVIAFGKYTSDTAFTEFGRFDNNGRLGIQKVPGDAWLEVVAPDAGINILATTSSPDTNGAIIMGRKSRGSSASPTAVLSGDTLATFSGAGYNGTNYTGSRAQVLCRAAENWTSTANGTDILFTTASLATNSVTEKVRISAGGNVGIGTSAPATTLDVAGIVSANGVKFPAVQVASANVNTLDDYEEGTFTPTISGATVAGTGTYTVQVGRYTKIGRLVSFSARVTWTAHTGTGALRIAGLPFTSASVANSHSAVTIGYANNLTYAATNTPMAMINPNTTLVAMFQMPSTGGAMAVVAMDTAADVIVSGTYQVG